MFPLIIIMLGIIYGLVAKIYNCNFYEGFFYAIVGLIATYIVFVILVLIWTRIVFGRL